MDDKLIIGFFVYMALSSAIITTLPDSFFNGSFTSATDRQDYVDRLNATTTQSGTDNNVSIGTLGKITRFLFMGWSIDGLPTIIALLIGIINNLGVILGVVWLYDKVRGIGS